MAQKEQTVSERYLKRIADQYKGFEAVSRAYELGYVEGAEAAMQAWQKAIDKAKVEGYHA